MTKLIPSYDLIVIGTELTALAIAYTAAQNGQKVAVFNQPSSMPWGVIAPFALPPSHRHLALSAREKWVELIRKAQLRVRTRGAFMLAFHEYEVHVLEAFLDEQNMPKTTLEMLTPQTVQERSPIVNPIGLEGAVWSPLDIGFDAREASRTLSRYLQDELAVDFFPEQTLSFSAPLLESPFGSWKTEKLIICNGTAFAEKVVQSFDKPAIQTQKIQLIKAGATHPIHLQQALFHALCYTHFPSFSCLPARELLHRRYRRELKRLKEYTPCVNLLPEANGLLNLGCVFLPEQPEELPVLEDLLLRYARKICRTPSLRIVSSKQITYQEAPEVADEPMALSEQVYILPATSAASLSLSFNMADVILNKKNLHLLGS